MIRKANKTLLFAGITAVLLLALSISAFAQYTQMTTYPNVSYTGVTTDRGIAVNTNTTSPYYGYIYACDGTTSARTIRILRPDPLSDGMKATNYVDTGSTIVTPGNDLYNSVFIGTDDTVWAPNYSQKKVQAYTASGTLLTEFSTTKAPRSVCVVGKVGVAGTKAYVAESTWATPFDDDAEIYEFDGSNWNLVAEFNDFAQLSHIYSVTVDSAGNSYWAGNNSSTVVKVTPDYNIDTNFIFTMPSWLLSINPHTVKYVNDPTDVNNPEYLYVSFNATATSANYGSVGAPGVLRLKLDGTYIDGFGSTWEVTGYPDTYYGGQELVTPGGDGLFWMDVDDSHNIYIITQMYDWVYYTGGYITLLGKFHRSVYTTPAAPTDGVASNDVYGQIKLSWTNNTSDTAVYDSINIYRSTDTTKPTEVYDTITDGYNKWKDTTQGQTAGGPFYYWVSAVNSMGESTALGPIGPISVTSSTAPEQRSLNTALSYSEVSKLDTVECGGFDSYFNSVTSFLDNRGVSYTKVWDADSTQLNIENDDIAGHTLLILSLNRDMTSYTAQCIRDYVKYNGGRVFSGYFNSLANGKIEELGDFALSDIYRLNNEGWDGDYTSVDWWTKKYCALKPVSGVSESAALFEGIPDGAIEPITNPYTFLVSPYTDGTAKVVGTISSRDGSNAPTLNAGAVIGYYNGEPRSLYTGILWWEMNADSGRTYSGAIFLENCLKFFGLDVTPYVKAYNLGDSQISIGDNHFVAYDNLVVTQQTWAVTGNNYVWAEAADRTSGIKLVIPSFISQTTFSPGDTLRVSGVLNSDYADIDGTTVCGDRILDCRELYVTGATTPIKPLYIQNKSVVGPYIGHQQGVVDGAFGINNLGLYVKISGKVTYVNTDESGSYINYFYVDDGSNLKDGTTHLENDQPVENVGVRICSTVQSQNDLQIHAGADVSVIGCTSLSLEAMGNGEVGIRSIIVPGIWVDNTCVTVY